jgi:hypothetical protein
MQNKKKTTDFGTAATYYGQKLCFFTVVVKTAS